LFSLPQLLAKKRLGEKKFVDYFESHVTFDDYLDIQQQKGMKKGVVVYELNNLSKRKGTKIC